MMEETKPELIPSFLEQVKQEREALEKIRDENKKIIEELRELRADAILSGNTNAGQKTEEKPKELTPKEYAEKALEGKIGK